MPVPEWWSSYHTVQETDGKVTHREDSATYCCRLYELHVSAEGHYFSVDFTVNDDCNEAFRIDAEELWRSGGYDQMRELVRQQALQRLIDWRRYCQ